MCDTVAHIDVESPEWFIDKLNRSILIAKEVHRRRITKRMDKKDKKGNEN